LNQLKSDSFVKRRVDEARKLEQELYGDLQTPTWDKVTKSYWTKREQSDEYLGKLRFDKFVKDRVDEARKLENALYGKNETPEWHKTDKDYWGSVKQSDSYLNQLRSDNSVKKRVDEARYLQMELTGKYETPTYDQIMSNPNSKKYWGSVKQTDSYLGQLRFDSFIKQRVDAARKLETEIYSKSQTNTWDNVKKEWWNNENNVATYLGELTEKYKIIQSEKTQLAELEQSKLIMESQLEEVVKKSGGEDSPRKMFKLFDTVKTKAKKLAELGNNQEAEEWRNLAEQIQEKHKAINKPRLFVEILGSNVNSLISQGHVRIGLYDQNTQKLQNYGNNPGTNFNEESQEHSYRHSIIFKMPLAEQQQNRCIATINELKKTEVYELLADNCIDSANKVLKGCETGITVHDLLEQIPDNLDNSWLHQSLRYYAKKSSSKYK
jgi:hypothetical protein